MSEYFEVKIDGGTPMSVRKDSVVMFRPRSESIRNEKGIGFHDGTEMCLSTEQVDSGGILVDVKYDDFKKMMGC